MIEREERIGECRLLLGDCLEIQDGWYSDSLITDPVWPNAPDGMFEMAFSAEELLSRALSRASVKRMAIVMRTDSDPRILRAVPERYRFVRHQNLEYVATGYLGRVLGGMEIVYGFGEPIASVAGRRVIPGNSDRVQPGKEKVAHPCPRRVEHMDFVVRWWSDLGETVLDPFMGSGTTGISCIRLERRFVGIEKDRSYFEVACDRIHRAWDLKCSELPFESGLVQRSLLGLEG